MNDKINPRIVDGEPVCNSECYRYHDNPPCWVNTVHSRHAICIPGLRQQRDEALEQVKLEIKGRDSAIHHGINLEEHLDAARRELCELESSFLQHPKPDMSSKEIAKQRGWDYLFESEDNDSRSK